MKQKYKLTVLAFMAIFLSLLAPLAFTAQAGATNTAPPYGLLAANTCGAGEHSYKPAIEIGCVGKGNPIVDALFAIIRFLSLGVGIVLVGSMVYAGVQYTASRGDPKATSEAINRIQATVFALFLFIFGYALLNYIIPAGVLK